MSNIKKLMVSAGGGAGPDVDEVFSIVNYRGTGADLTITNNIDLSTEGGMVWIKGRLQYSDHIVFDTERGTGLHLATNRTNDDNTRTDSLKAFNSNGFSIGNYSEINTAYGSVGYDYVSWTFRKAPNFFDVVTYTGNGGVSKTIDHNLGSTPGMILVKSLDGPGGWYTFHRSIGNTKYLWLDTNGASQTGAGAWNNTSPTATQFTVGTNNAVNENNKPYVAYLFAHNDGAGGFGPDGNADIIKCGSYTGSGGDNNAINIGFEPQWFLTKRTDGSNNWNIVDSMRGFTSKPGGTGEGNYGLRLSPNNQNPDSSYWQQHRSPSGVILDSANADSNASGANYIYVAIRRGPLAVPESATDVFDVSDIAGNGATDRLITTTNRVDMAFGKRQYTAAQDWALQSRLQGNGVYLKPHEASSEAYDSNNRIRNFEPPVGFVISGSFYNASGNPAIVYSWKRAPQYFDMVAYTGTGAVKTVDHTLGSVPKMIWIKCTDSDEQWCVYHSGAGETKFLTLNQNYGTQTSSDRWNNTTPTDTQFSLGNHRDVNRNGQKYMAYLFGEVSGISKMGSYTGNGQAQVIDCGFTAGARFVMIKESSGTGDWHIFNAERGIVSGNDPYLRINLNSAEVTGDLIDPNNSGFALQAAYTTVNNLDDEYVFYAIA